MPISKACLVQRVPKTPHAYVMFGPDKYKRKAEAKMAWCDALPDYWRAFVHEYGMRIAKPAFYKYGPSARGCERALMAQIVDEFEL